MSFKTNAPHEFLMEMRDDWEKQDKNKDYKGKIDFSIDKELKKKFRKRPPRFLPNPEKYWGPKSSATMHRHNPKNKNNVKIKKSKDN